MSTARRIPTGRTRASARDADLEGGARVHGGRGDPQGLALPDGEGVLIGAEVDALVPLPLGQRGVGAQDDPLRGAGPDREDHVLAHCGTGEGGPSRHLLGGGLLLGLLTGPAAPRRGHDGERDGLCGTHAVHEGAAGEEQQRCGEEGAAARRRAVHRRGGVAHACLLCVAASVMRTILPHFSAERSVIARSSGKSIGLPGKSRRPAASAHSRIAAAAASAWAAGACTITSSCRKNARCARRENTGPEGSARSSAGASGNCARRSRSAAIHDSAHSAAVPCTTKLRVNRPRSRAERRARSCSPVPASGPFALRCAAVQAASGAGEERPSHVVTVPPRSPVAAAPSTSAIAAGKVRRSRGTTRPLSPVVPPYSAPTTPIFASCRVATTPASTIPE